MIRVRLETGVVDVWWARVSQAHPGLVGLLDPVERTRLDRYRFPEDRGRFLLGCAVVRLACGGYLDVPPERIMLDRACDGCGEPHGKPRLADPEAGVHLSISHSGDWVGVAATRTAPVGLDVERLRGVDPEELARLVLSGAESAASPVEFLRYWTRKEAVVKATGDGLRTPLTGVTVSAPDEPPALLDWPDRPDTPSRLSLYDLADRPGHLASLALLDARRHRIEERDATPLLG